MKGTITDIDPLKPSRHGGMYRRVYFRLEDGSWAKTDLVPGNHNYPRWDGQLVVGVSFDGLRMKSKATVDADSWPVRI